MAVLSTRKSYAETVEGRRRLLSRLGVLLLVFLAFELVAGLFLVARGLTSKSMEPTLSAGDLVLATPLAYGPDTFLGKMPAPFKPERGDLVLVEPPYAERQGFWKGLADSFVRFVTFQRLSLSKGEGSALNGPFVARVIALPGDTVEMEDFVFKVKTADSGHFLTEFELSDRRYDITKPSLPEGWKDSWPLSADRSPRVLGKDEYFVAGDNRGASSDSRLWGPVGIAGFKAKVFLRYWPVSRFGLP